MLKFKYSVEFVREDGVKVYLDNIYAPNICAAIELALQFLEGLWECVEVRKVKE